MNSRVRYAHGEDGTLVLVGAWCSKCRYEVLPSRHGRCGWCDRRIVTLAVAHGDVVAEDYTVAA